MKQFIRNLEKEYLAVVFLVVGILLLIFPEPAAKIAPWVLGCVLILRGILVLVLTLYYKDSQHGPGNTILYCVMGLTIMILGSDSTGIIGVIWAVFTLVGVAEEIDGMWKDKHCSAFHLILAAASVALAVMLMTDPLRHFVSHVRLLGLEIIFSCFARGIDIFKAKTKKDHPSDERRKR